MRAGRNIIWAWLAATLGLAVNLIGSYFCVHDFGALGDGVTDDRNAINAAIQAAIASERPAIVTFQPDRVYKLNRLPFAHGRILILNANDLTIDGQGATLLTDVANRHLGVYRSSGITIRNLQFDTDPVPFAQGEILTIDLADSSFVFEVDEGYPLPIVGQYSASAPRSDGVSFEADSRNFTQRWCRVSTVTHVEGRIFEVAIHPDRGSPDFMQSLQTGKLFAMKVFGPDGSDLRTTNGEYVSDAFSNIAIKHSNDVTLENIYSYAAPYITLRVWGGKGLHISNFNIIRKPGTDRLVASNSDGFHIKGILEGPVIKDSHFEAIMDDAINITLVADRITEVISPTEVEVVHMDIVTESAASVLGANVRIVRGDTGATIDEAVVQGVEVLNYRTHRLTLDREVEGWEVDDLVFIVPQGKSVIERSFFDTQLKTAILTRMDTMVKNCHFKEIAYGVHTFYRNDGFGLPRSRIEVVESLFEQKNFEAINFFVQTFEPNGIAELVLTGNVVLMDGPNSGAVIARNANSISVEGLTAVPRNGLSVTSSSLISLRNQVGEQNIEAPFIEDIYSGWVTKRGNSMSRLDARFDDNSITNGLIHFYGYDSPLASINQSELFRLTDDPIGVSFPMREPGELGDVRFEVQASESLNFSDPDEFMELEVSYENGMGQASIEDFMDQIFVRLQLDFK